eukprot:12666611-Ditylum_brightwellii.AAC.1
MVAPVMRAPVNCLLIWGTRPGWLLTNWSVEVPAPGLVSVFWCTDYLDCLDLERHGLRCA